LEGVKFFGEILFQKGLILVDMRARILMIVVSMTFFRPDEAEKTMKTA
jgi:hypothetical protein